MAISQRNLMLSQFEQVMNNLNKFSQDFAVKMRSLKLQFAANVVQSDAKSLMQWTIDDLSSATASFCHEIWADLAMMKPTIMTNMENGDNPLAVGTMDDNSAQAADILDQINVNDTFPSPYHRAAAQLIIGMSNQADIIPAAVTKKRKSIDAIADDLSIKRFKPAIVEQVLPIAKVKKFECKDCGKFYCYKRSLWQHMKVKAAKKALEEAKKKTAEEEQQDDASAAKEQPSAVEVAEESGASSPATSSSSSTGEATD